MLSGPSTFDLFVSHRWSDKPWVLALVTALELRGVTCWVDRQEVEPAGGITTAILRGLAHSRALLACYSHEYPKSEICLRELTLAYLAGEQFESGARRVIVVNPEPDAHHIRVGELADQLTIPIVRSSDPDHHAEAAQAIEDALVSRSGVIGSVVNVPLHWVGGVTPIRTRRFVGRLAEMWSVHDALGRIRSIVNDPGSAGRLGVVALVGAGGMGKSMLAEEYAARFAASYSGGAFWLSARGFGEGGRPCGFDDEVLARALGDIAGALSLVVSNDPTVTELRERIGAALEEQPYLWVVDDLPTKLSRRELDAWSAPSAQGSTLITTRSLEYAYLHTVPVDGLPADDGVALLSARPALEACFDSLAARRITAALGGHALALDVAGALLSSPGAPSMLDFAAQLENPVGAEIANLGAGEHEQLPTGHEASITLTLRRSFDLLDNDQRLVMGVVGCAAPDPIPLSLPLLQLAMARRTWAPASRAAITSAVGKAIALCLLSSSGPASGEVRIHPIVAAVARALAVETIEDRAALVDALERVLSPVERPRQLQGLSSAIAQARYLTRVMMTKQELALGRALSLCDHHRGACRSAIDVCGRMLEASRELLGPDDPLTIQATSNLAGALHEGGRTTEAIKLLEQVLIHDERLGASPSETILTRSNLAVCLTAVGRTDEAIALLATIAAEQDRMKSSFEARVITRNNLGAAYVAAGRYLEAVSEYRDLLADVEDAHVDPDEVVLLWGNLAAALDRAGRPADAERLHDRVQQYRTLHFGPYHPSTLTARTNLAETLRNSGRPAEAIAELDDLLKHAEREHGAGHPTTLTARLVRADCLNPADRATAINDALATAMVELGPTHPLTLRAQADLGRAYTTAGNPAEAVAVCQRAYDGLHRLHGERHPSTLTAGLNLAGAFVADGQQEAAMTTFDEVVGLMERLYGIRDQRTMVGRNNRAAALTLFGQAHEAAVLLTALVADRTAVHGPTDERTLTSRINLARACFDDEDLLRATNELDAVSAAAVQVWGPEDKRTIEVLCSLRRWTS